MQPGPISPAGICLQWETGALLRDAATASCKEKTEKKLQKPSPLHSAENSFTHFNDTMKMKKTITNKIHMGIVLKLLKII